MKHRITLAISLFAPSAGSYTITLCQEKEQNIQRKISYAEKRNNQSRINGLNKTLSKVRVDYTGGKLRANRREKIVEQKNEIAERQRSSAETKQEGDTEKVAKHEHEPAEVQQELKELETRDYQVR